MPYGIKNETPKQTAWMEKCVNSVMDGNKDMTKSRAIAICKVQLKKTGTSEEAISEESLREKFYQFEDKIRDALSPQPDMVSPRNGPYVVDIYDDYVIVEMSDKMYKLPYSINGEDVTFDWSKAIEVERVTNYEPVKEAETKTKVPPLYKRDGGRVITYGGRTVN